MGSFVPKELSTDWIGWQFFTSIETTIFDVSLCTGVVIHLESEKDEYTIDLTIKRIRHKLNNLPAESIKYHLYFIGSDGLKQFEYWLKEILSVSTIFNFVKNKIEFRNASPYITEMQIEINQIVNFFCLKCLA